MTRKKPGADRKRTIILPKSDLRVIRAATLDRAADVELVLGHIAIAERLARLAAEIREAGR